MSITAEPLRLRLRCDASAPRLARQAVASLPALATVREDALLVVSELATNAVRHSGSAPEDELLLQAERTAAGVRIAVTDSGRSQSVPAPREGNRREPGGMGLRLVEAVARRWGSERDGSVRVWAELAL